MEKRGYTLTEALAYVGVGRRTFEALWRPHLNPFRCGTSLIFDRIELDALFERFKAGELGEGSDPSRPSDPAEQAVSPPTLLAPTSRRRSNPCGQASPAHPGRLPEADSFAAVAARILKDHKKR